MGNCESCTQVCGHELVEERPSRHANFAAELEKGMAVTAVSAQGRTVACMMSRSTAELVIAMLDGTVLRRAEISKVEAVHEGREPADISTPLDDLCVTLELAGSDDTSTCFTLRFSSVSQREQFADGMRALVVQARKQSAH